MATILRFPTRPQRRLPAPRPAPPIPPDLRRESDDALDDFARSLTVDATRD